MATLQSHFQFSLSNSPKLVHLKNPHSFSFSKKVLLPKKLFSAKRFNGLLSSSFITNSVASSSSSSSAEIEKSVLSEIVNERPPFDINLAVILAGFAFEAYTTPPENVGKREMDAAKCQTVFLSESFVREIYDGQLFVKLKKGFNLPAMDPWGTSDPYIIMQLDCQISKSKVKWGTKEPKWNEEFALNIKQPPIHDLQVAAWDANLVAPHKRMGNASINLVNLCDGNSHEVLLDLEGMGGGGKIELEIKYKSFEKIDDEKKWWKIPLVTDFLQKHGLEPALKMIVGSETVQAREFVQFAFGRLKSLNDSYLQQDWFSKTKLISDPNVKDKQPELEDNEGSTNKMSQNQDSYKGPQADDNAEDNVDKSLEEIQVAEDSWSDNQFWKNLADSINQNVVQKLGLPAPEKMKFDGFDVLKNFGLLSREIAEASYIESGLATPNSQEVVDGDAKDGSTSSGAKQTSLTDIKKVTQDILRQTDSILGALMVVNAAVSKLTNEAGLIGKNEDTSVKVKKEVSGDEESKALIGQQNELILNEKEAEEMRELFSTAESAMEAWALLANALGHPTFIKSEFEKICFLDNAETDTQVAIWRDLKRKRLVIAFRGTEQTKWKDLVTDLMLVPAGLNPERIGGDFKNEVQVHSGFLSAYDSVRTRLITLIKQATGHRGDSVELLPTWNIYVTGHSLGGALATLMALELSSSQLAQCGAISVTMYNFGSPRVGNRRFAEIYNEKVKDSWRLVNHRDIIPTVPRLMGYCHVAHPVYLTARNQTDEVENLDVLEVGYEADIIGEATPDVIVSEFMRGEKELVENILNTEINIFLAIRDGTALMQHMEDFYYITLLEKVRSNYKTVGGSQPADRNLSAQPADRKLSA
ncbi:putative triglyceride lipase [Perilla frutescens var. hirtella]|uniref:Triglyceride lipase n=1 Tax=Perilla frutescens var. hirtella TaxID=608512 RepID=A0AAD4NZX9_PERFH|nr:putative triglyceride lipase [Perilla frutescens var. hirtella]